MSSPPPKLVLCVIDAMAPEMLERVVADGVAPMLAALIENGRYVPDCVAAFPSVTPVCAASIVTGVGQDEHLIPAMNWYHRGEEPLRRIRLELPLRSALRHHPPADRHGLQHEQRPPARSTPTVFESLDDAGLRTAGTTYLMYRGRHRHEPQRDTALTRVASTLMRHPVMGPRELFYADIFASRRTGCRSGLGMPGVRDRHSGCVASYLVEHDLFDFLLLSLPDNDWYSHKRGPDAQLHALAQADLQLARVMNAAGGIELFLEDHAVIVMADHSQASVTATIALQDELAELGVLGRAPGAPKSNPDPPASPCARRSGPRWSTRCTSPSGTRCARRSPPRPAPRGDRPGDLARAGRPRTTAGRRHREPRPAASCASAPAAS